MGERRGVVLPGGGGDQGRLHRSQDLWEVREDPRRTSEAARPRQRTQAPWLAVLQGAVRKPVWLELSG